MEENTRRMLAGQLYDPYTDELQTWIKQGHRLSHDYNLLSPDDTAGRAALLDRLLGSHGEDVHLAGPIYFDYGRFTTIGSRVKTGTHLTVLDICPVTIGDDVVLGPNVSLLAAQHPLTIEERNPREIDGRLVGCEFGGAITIGAGCRIAGNVTIVGPVEIGEDCVITAGSVVTKDIPAHSLVGGVPGRVLESLN